MLPSKEAELASLKNQLEAVKARLEVLALTENNLKIQENNLPYAFNPFAAPIRRKLQEAFYKDKFDKIAQDRAFLEKQRDELQAQLNKLLEEKK
jgi:hypothetical protein